MGPTEWLAGQRDVAGAGDQFDKVFFLREVPVSHGLIFWKSFPGRFRVRWTF
jgi:hypothetical protein